MQGGATSCYEPRHRAERSKLCITEKVRKRRRPAATADPSSGHCSTVAIPCQSGKPKFPESSRFRKSTFGSPLLVDNTRLVAYRKPSPTRSEHGRIARELERQVLGRRTHGFGPSPWDESQLGEPMVASVPSLTDHCDQESRRVPWVRLGSLQPSLGLTQGCFWKQHFGLQRFDLDHFGDGFGQSDRRNGRGRDNIAR